MKFSEYFIIRPPHASPRFKTAFWLWFTLCLISTNAKALTDVQPIRIGITPVIVHEQYELLNQWRSYLQNKLGVPVEFVSRDNYLETINLLKQRKLDFAWIADFPYVYLEHYHLVRLLVTPIYQGRPFYRAYLIVPSSDLLTRSLIELNGKVFAYVEFDSFSGYLIPRYQLQQAGIDSSKFFRKTFFTLSHRKVIEAVAHGLADGGMVDSFVWDALSKIHKDISDNTRIVAKSQEFGFPPIVAGSLVSRKKFSDMQRVLMEMTKDPEGIQLLKQLQLDKFGPPLPELYLDVKRIMIDFEDL